MCSELQAAGRGPAAFGGTHRAIRGLPPAPSDPPTPRVSTPRLSCVRRRHILAPTVHSRLTARSWTPPTPNDASRANIGNTSLGRVISRSAQNGDGNGAGKFLRVIGVESNTESFVTWGSHDLPSNFDHPQGHAPGPTILGSSRCWRLFCHVRFPVPGQGLPPTPPSSRCRRHASLSASALNRERWAVGGIPISSSSAGLFAWAPMARENQSRDSPTPVRGEDGK